MEPTGTEAILARHGWIRRFAAVGGRYGIATLGPLSVSAAHFLASLALLRILPPAEFGLFAFLLVFIGFSFSLSNALFAAPYSVAANQRTFSADSARVFFKANLLFSVTVGFVCGGIAYAMHAGDALTPLLFGLFGGFATLRWFARAHAFAMHMPVRVAIADIIYAILILSGLVVTWLLHDLTLDKALLTFAVAATIAVAAFGNDYLKRQFIDAFAGRLREYAPIWRNQARWTLLGVASTEATLNAHSYLVTLVAGPAAFAPIAAAALFLRPVPMCANSLTALERPAMARAIAAGNIDEALRRVRHYRWAVMMVWLATVTAMAVIFLQFPTFVFSEHYSLMTIITAAVFLASVEGIQSWLVPDAALLQAADKFRPLASATVISGLVTVIAATLLLFAFGPVISLAGVLLGEMVLAYRFVVLKRAWRMRS